ncbi:MAG: hypothetical protein AAGA89_17440, partial [Pseudomonadota bacterium]
PAPEPEPETNPLEDILNRAISASQPAPTRPTGGREIRLTSGEEDQIRDRIRGCWNVDINAREPEAVEIRAQLNPDFTVKSAEVVDQRRYNSDANYRSAADRALRAVRNPTCQPLPLTAERYEEGGGVMVLNFDPSLMF